ncbi:cilia- and flagella-associated protein 44-like [Neoarius graeffei]|uniref:cilia- and flagella-associated protein 44-like n=1 Tax=Neoarius graeffei TaxID=443677 RepID=UPI00298C4E41|nr:cilia- and flagella-associated protein 44-like [Neoarius graeffei]
MAAEFTSEESSIPQNLLQLLHSFGYDCKRRGNLHLLDEDTLAFVAGNMLVLLDMNTKEQRYIPSSGGGGIGAMMPHPSRSYFAVAEKGEQPDIIIYEYPSLQPYRTLRGGTCKAYSCVNFNNDGTLLASVGGATDYMLTLWDWNQEQVVLRYKAFSQDVYCVTFSPYNPCQLTTAGSGHIKFWKMADTFTGLKLQGMLGRFGKTPLTDIDGYVELPDGKVISGSEWGNMLLWDGDLIKVELRRKDGRNCHAGPIHQFALDEGELITVGADGAVRTWDFETIDTADCMDDSGLFEIKPMNELIVGRNVNLSCMVRSSIPQSSIWFAQDSNGGIWKLDLSFSNLSRSPECLFSFHAGAIKGMDVSGFSHLMATTALDCSVRIFDFLSNKELAVSHYVQGGSTLTWAPRTVCGGESLLVVGFEDGVVRLLELSKPQSLYAISESNLSELCLKQAFKPHDASVTAISYKHDGQIMATGSVDGTVFFFSVGDSYEPVGFVKVPGPVQGLQWAPQSHERNALLVTCQVSHVVEIEAPDTLGPVTGNTYYLPNLPIRHFCFQSIKSRIKRDEEIARRQAMKEKRQKEAKDQEQTPTEEEEEELPPICIPDTPSPLHCTFYSTEPGAFWLSVGGYDSGYLYHCKFSEQQSVDLSERKDEPFAHVPIQDADRNPILTVCFCEARQLLLCGMQDGSIRAYPLESEDLQPVHMQAYCTLSIHDSQYGSLQQLCISHDGRFVLSTGADGNIFSFRLLEMEELEKVLQREHAKVPSPRLILDTEPVPVDINDPAAYSIETAAQKLELDRMHQEAESKKQERREKLAELQIRYKAILGQNQSLPEHMRLQPMELEINCRFREENERSTAERVKEARRELAWETERCSIALQKLHDWILGSSVCDTVTVSAISSDHNVSTYSLIDLAKKLHQLNQQERVVQDSDPDTLDECSSKEEEETEVISDQSTAEEDSSAAAGLRVQVPQRAVGKLAARQAEKLRKATEKAQKVRAKLEQKKREWDKLYATKPSDNYEDPEDIRAIQLAKENLGDFKLKTEKGFIVPQHLRMNVEKKMAQFIELGEQIYQRKSHMNMRVLALRDLKVALVSQFHSYMHQLLAVQKLLPPEKHRPPPTMPTLTPEETPDRELERYSAARAQMSHSSWDDEQEESQDDKALYTWEEYRLGFYKHTISGENLTEVKDVLELEELLNLHVQHKLIKKMEEAICEFNAKFHLLRYEKGQLDVQMNLAKYRHITLFEELHILKVFEKREFALQERRNACLKEQRALRSKMEECKHQLEVKNRDIAKLRESEKVLFSTFKASVEENTFADFLTKVFKKKIKRVKKKEKLESDDEEEESEEDSDEDSDWDSDEDDEGFSETSSIDYNVCPPNCNPELFENTLRLREHRLDLEEQLHAEKIIADSLKKDYDSLTKKVKIVQSNLKAVDGDLELLNQEKQQKVNELDAVVPLRLHQIEYMNNGVMPSDLSEALVINATSVSQLHKRIQELEQEKIAQKQLYRQARKQHVQLRADLRDMEAKSQELKAHCEQLMMKKFGKMVDLEALQTLGGNQKLEELKYLKQVQEAQHMKELRMWEEKVIAARQKLTNVTRENTERLRKLNSLLIEKKLVEDKLNARQKIVRNQFQVSQQAEVEEIQSLQLYVQNQEEKIKWLKQEISTLSLKAPCPTRLPPHTAHQRRIAGMGQARESTTEKTPQCVLTPPQPGDGGFAPGSKLPHFLQFQGSQQADQQNIQSLGVFSQKLEPKPRPHKHIPKRSAPPCPP